MADRALSREQADAAAGSIMSAARAGSSAQRPWWAPLSGWRELEAIDPRQRAAAKREAFAYAERRWTYRICVALWLLALALMVLAGSPARHASLLALVAFNGVVSVLMLRINLAKRYLARRR